MHEPGEPGYYSVSYAGSMSDEKEYNTAAIDDP